MIPDPAPPYEVTFAAAVQDRITALLTRSAALGCQPEIDAVLRIIDDDLHQRPRVGGDPIKNFRKLQMVQYRGFLYPLVAVYTVHDRLPWVVLAHVKVVKGHPLAGS